MSDRTIDYRFFNYGVKTLGFVSRKDVYPASLGAKTFILNTTRTSTRRIGCKDAQDTYIGSLRLS